MNIRLAIVLLLFIVTIHANSQVSFTKGNDLYRGGVNHNSGIAGGCIDLNGDYYDDIIALNRSRVLEVGYNNGTNQKMNWQSRVNVSSTEEYSIVAGDINNDGQCELISSGVYNGAKIFKSSAQGNYLLQGKLQPFVYGQAANFADVNNDGYLDFFLCNDEGDNLIYLNDKNGNLIQNNSLLNFNTIPPSDNSGNYGSEWCDVDNDGDLDLYIAKCKVGADNVEDPRRHNMLMINNNGSFKNEAEVRGLRDKGQSWTGSFADYDNDGDLDCMVTNHDQNHRLYENDGKGFFTISKAELALNTSYAFQSLWADFDNNGWQDLLLVGDGVTEIYLNVNGKKFNKQNKPFNNFFVNSASIGDLNDDGFIDVMAIYGKEINNPSNLRDEIWINNANQNNYLKILLKGVKSNNMGVGTKLTLYTPQGIQYRELQAGVSYGVSNSNNILFGIGTSTAVDSIVVKWPSGVVDKLINPKINTSHLFTEGICNTQRLKIGSQKSILCPNEVINLTLDGLPTSGVKITWNTGTNAPALSINTPGNYYAKVQLENGCNYVSDIKTISSPLINKIIQNTNSNTVTDTLYFCDQIRLSAFPFYRMISWSNGQVGNAITLQQNTSVTVTALDVCNQLIEEKVNVVKLPSIANVINTADDTVKVGQNALLIAKGENVAWFNASDELVTFGDSLFVPNVQVQESYYAATSSRKGFKTFTIGETSLPASSNLYSANSLDFGLLFQTFDNVIIKSVDVATDREAVRRIIIVNDQGKRVFQKDFLIKTGSKQTCLLNAYLPAGNNYTIKTDTAINNQNLGYRSPRLMRLQDSGGYPFEINSLMEISSSSSNSVDYYYFFNIVVENIGTICTSEKTKANIVIELIKVDEKYEDAVINCYPNPVINNLNILSEQKFLLSITDVSGKVLRREKINEGETTINLSTITDGIYLLNFASETAVYRKKIIINH